MTSTAPEGGPSFPGIFYDGQVPRPREVTLRFAESALEILDSDGLLASWPYGDVRRSAGATAPLRLSSLSAPELARLEVAHPAAPAALEARCHGLGRGRGEGARTARIVFWCAAAAVSLILTAVYLVPIAADRLAALIPRSWEVHLGRAVDNQVRIVFGNRACVQPRGLAALDRLTQQLAPGGGVPVDIAVLDTAIPNAIALPGGRIYMFRGLLEKAENVDEVAGVLAHEIGHTVHRDGLRRLLQTGGTSFLLGLLFGDVTGGGAIILAGRTIIEGSHSREAETAADRHAADAMLALGRSPEAMGHLLMRINGNDRVVPPFLSSHPVTEDRLKALASAKPHAEGAALLSEEEWRALKSICKAP